MSRFPCTSSGDGLGLPLREFACKTSSEMALRAMSAGHNVVTGKFLCFLSFALHRRRRAKSVVRRIGRQVLWSSEATGSVLGHREAANVGLKGAWLCGPRHSCRRPPNGDPRGKRGSASAPTTSRKTTTATTKGRQDDKKRHDDKEEDKEEEEKEEKTTTTTTKKTTITTTHSARSEHTGPTQKRLTLTRLSNLSTEAPSFNLHFRQPCLLILSS